MGQRSQIYVRYNGNLLFATYYQWNYGERMISRARWGIEYLKYNIDHGFDRFMFNQKGEIEKIKRLFDVNFDMHDVAMGCDILKEREELYPHEDFSEAVFNNQDNNDGQLYVDIQDGKIYYGFRWWEWMAEDNQTVEKLLSAREYMDTDMENWKQSPYIPDEQKKLCVENIEAIGSMATLMDDYRLKDFIEHPYKDN